MATKREKKVPSKRGRAQHYGEGGLAIIPGWSPKPDPQTHRPTERSRTMVEMMSAYGAPQLRIAAILDINVKTLVAYYRQELTLGSARADMAVVGNLFRIATLNENTAPVVNAAQWWTKARMGWSEIRRTQADVRTLSGNVRDLTDAELVQIIDAGGTTSSGEQGAVPSESEPGEFG